MMRFALVLALAFPALAFADDTITYRSEGGCNGDFERSR
jgi:hypothetical protein